MLYFKVFIGVFKLCRQYFAIHISYNTYVVLYRLTKQLVTLLEQLALLSAFLNCIFSHFLKVSTHEITY